MSSYSSDEWINVLTDYLVPVYTCGVAGTILLGNAGGACAAIALVVGASCGVDYFSMPWIDYAAPIYTLVGLFMLYSSSSTKDEEDEEDEAVELVPTGEKPDMTGVWKMKSCDNYDAYLEAVRIGPVMRGIIKRAPVWQMIKQNGDDVELLTKTSVMTMGQTYRIGGAPVVTRVRNDRFEDTVYWENDHLMLLKVNRKHKYEILVRRFMKGSKLAVVQTVKFVNPDRKDVVLNQIFTRSKQVH